MKAQKPTGGKRGSKKKRSQFLRWNSLRTGVPLVGLEETKGDKSAREEYSGAEPTDKAQESSNIIAKKRHTKKSVLLP